MASRTGRLRADRSAERRVRLRAQVPQGHPIRRPTTLYDSVTVTTGGGGGGGGITNGGFETGSLSGWTSSGAHTGVSTTAHTGLYSAMAGNTTATNGDSTIAQTFTNCRQLGYEAVTIAVEWQSLRQIAASDRG